MLNPNQFPRTWRALAASLFAVAVQLPATLSASCIDPNECLCGHNLVVRAVSAETPWIVEVKQILDGESACPVAVGDQLELHLLDVDAADAGTDADAGEPSIRPNLPADHDVIARISCEELSPSYMVVEDGVAVCNTPAYDGVAPSLPVEDVVEANSSGSCPRIVNELRPPPPCDDMREEVSCSTLGGPKPVGFLMLLGLALIRFRPRRA